MTMRRRVLLAAALAFTMALGGKATAQADEPASVRSATVLTIHGKIAAVDETEKLVTLEANGKKVTFRVDNPYNLKNSKVGDPVVVRYYEVVSVRKKKADEQIPSVSVKEGITTAQSGTPGAVAEEQARVLVTVVDIDQANGTVTIKGPDGSIEKVKAADPNNLKLIKAGDELVVTVTRATAIAIEKEPAS
jgi:hypothetical protein